VISFIRSDYYSALADYGFLHKTAWEQSKNKKDLDESVIDGVEVKESDIHGEGLFAVKSYQKGDFICMAREGSKRTIAGRYSNHSPYNNAVMAIVEEGFILIAVNDISPGEEITTNYRLTLALQVKPARDLLPLDDRQNLRGSDSAAYDLLFNQDHVNCLSLRDRVLAFEYVLSGLPQTEIPVVHEFIDGLYRREITFKAGTLATGRIHKEDHMDVMLSGVMYVADEDGFKCLKGPCTLTSRAGKKKAGYALTDVVWTTYHPTKSKTVEDVEQELFMEDFDEITGEIATEEAA